MTARPNARTWRAAAFAFASLAATPLSAHQDLASLDLASFRGQVVYLDFWASWCAPCRRSFPWLDAMQAKYGKDGFVVVAVNVDTERRLASDFLADVPVGFRIAYDPQGRLARQWELMGMPSSFLIGRDGEVRGKHTGFRAADEAALEQAIARLLSEKG